MLSIGRFLCNNKFAREKKAGDADERLSKNYSVPVSETEEADRKRRGDRAGARGRFGGGFRDGAVRGEDHGVYTVQGLPHRIGGRYAKYPRRIGERRAVFARIQVFQAQEDAGKGVRRRAASLFGTHLFPPPDAAGKPFERAVHAARDERGVVHAHVRGVPLHSGRARKTA